MNKLHIGIDLGGTKIEAIVLADNSDIVFRHRIATPQGDYQGTLSAIAELVKQCDAIVEQQLGAKTLLPVGFSTPGSPSPLNGLMRNCNSTCLNHQPLPTDLEHLLQRPIRVANDANCLVLSEATDGAARNAHTVFGVILGTGVGGGIVVNKQLLHGVNHIAGEWGHYRVLNPDRTPRPCYCGRQDCIETYFSGPGFSETFRRVSLKEHTAEEITNLMRAGNSKATTCFEHYCEQLAIELARVIDLLDPDVIVLGGGLSNIKELYEEVSARWIKHIFSDVVNTKLLPAMYGDSSGVRGAAWLF